MASKNTLISVAVGSAFVATLSATPLALAGENPFALQSLEQGHQVADSKGMKEGKCGEGKCGASMKAGEGKCGMSMADANKDGKVSQDEFNKHHATMFGMMDANKDGFIDKTEMDKMSKMMHGKDMEGKCGAKK